jgi:hydroxymethylpyrimidine/phosphomethylpyrimidine kinase
LKTKSKILIIAGSDSSGGAGIQADIKTVTALGSYAMTAVTAVTAQNTKGVKEIVSISSKNLQKQITMVLDDIGTNSLKIGMLHNTAIIKCVYKVLKKYKIKNINLDPVMISKGGSRLVNKNSIKYLKKLLLPLCNVVTPNIPEAEILTGIKIKTVEDMIYAASLLIRLGTKNVLIKGGHLDSKFVHDIFVNKKEIKIIKNRRITTKNTHGTGCTLSTAIATFFSCGKTLKKSCELATMYVHNSIGSNLKYGKGHGPINHLSSILIDKKFR